MLKFSRRSEYAAFGRVFSISLYTPKRYVCFDFKFLKFKTHGPY